ncbi:hypothetical protein HYU20_00480, partial [Candidatus Woesearchaeota archaeon]|nr:hypothetical protein [Candidatus Woesearchaeota archaeon]
IVNDSANNQFLPTINITLDNTRPNASIIINNGDANTSSAAVTLRLGFNDTLAGVQSCRLSDENRQFGEWEGCVAQRSWTLNAGSGLKTVVVQVKDNADNVNETNDTITYQALAAVTILRPATDAALAGNVLIEAVGPATTAKMEFRIYNGTSYWPVGGGSAGSTNDSTPETGFSATWATSSFVDTIYNLSAIAYDASGNYIANDTNTNIEVDNTAPAAPTLTALPAFDADGIVTLNWSNVTASTADVVYYNIYRSTNVSFEISSAARIKNVSRNFNFTTDFPGINAKYYYKVTAVDNVLFESAPSNEVSTTITAAVGAVFGTLSANASVIRNGSSVLFTFAGNKLGLNVTINQSEMRNLDNTSGALLLNDSGVNGDFLMEDATYSAAYTLNMLNNESDGLKQLVAEVNDSAGNYFRPRVNITLDNTKPNVTVIINGNLSLTTSRIVSLAVTANDSVGIGNCRFANEDRVFNEWESCTSTKAWQLSALTGGKVVVVQARDKAGNVQEHNDSIEYRAPIAGELAASPFVVRNGVNITFSYTGSNVGFNATVNTTELQRLDNTSTKAAPLLDDGIGPDATANDGVYTGNYSVSSLNNASDGIKRITATVNDTEGNVLRPAVNITLDNTRPNATISIFGLSPAGFTNVSTEYTFSRAVTLVLGFNDTLGGTATTVSGGVRDCRFANENQQFTDWEACTTAKGWLLSDSNGNKTAIVEVRDLAGNVNRTNDTIYMNTTGAGLDQSQPTTPTVVDDGLYTNINSALHAKWNATDYENDLLRIPLEWEYRIAFDNFTRRINDTWQYAGIATETTVYGLNLSDGSNYTFEVRAINTAAIRSTNGTSDGIIVDTISPTTPLVNSTASQTAWTSGNVVTFNFTATDNASGVASFSYALDTNSTTIPDNVPESMNQHTLLAGSYNDGKSTILKFNNTGNASAVFVEVKSNLSANDVVRVTVQLAEASTETADAMGFAVYVISNPPTGFDMTGSNISRIVNTTQDIAFVSSVLDATSYTVDVPSGWQRQTLPSTLQRRRTSVLSWLRAAPTHPQQPTTGSRLKSGI